MANKFLIIIYIVLEINLFNCYIVLPIETLSKQSYLSKYKANTTQELISREFTSPIMTRLNLGTPEKEIPLLIKPRTNHFLVTSTNPLVKATINYTNKILYNFPKNINYFNETNSTSFISGKWVTNKIVNTTTPIAEGVCPCTEKFSFYTHINMTKTNKKAIPKTNFNLAKNIRDNIPGVIGLNLFDANSNKNISFLNELKTKSLIGDYCWYFNFDKWNNTNGKLIIGLLPHEMNVSNTSSKILVYANNTKNSNFWEMKFDQIYFMNKTDNNKKVSSNNQTVELNFDSNVIIGTKEYKNKLTLIIKELIDAKTCNSSTILAYDDEFNNLSSNYTFYYCSNDNKTIYKLNELLPSLYFYSSEFNYTFEITKEQILKENNGMVYIHILFSQSSNKWVLGKPMTFKYQLIFNQNLGKIGFYNIFKNINDNEKDIDNDIDKRNKTIDNENKTIENNEKNESNDTVFKLLIIIPLIIYLCAGPIILAAKKVMNKKSDEDSNNNDDKKDDDKIGILIDDKNEIN